MIKCPKCAGAAGVLQSRTQPDNTMWRRRECKQCGHRWSTREISQIEWKGIQSDQEKRSIHATAMSEKATLARRGFLVPDHLREEYNHLRLSKRIPAREAARMLGII